VSEQNSHLEQMGLGLGLRLDRPEPDTIPTQLGGESYVHELISSGAPLAEVLDRLCSTLNVEIGNVASVVLLADGDEEGAHTLAKCAARFGLSNFRSAGIFSRDGELLGTLETYCCPPRTATPSEIKIIERARQVAAFAIERRRLEEGTRSVLEA
jgi:hypothetical protein